jgi:cytochrome c-type biogenesis protein CcmF
MHPGETQIVAGDTYRFDSTAPVEGPNYSADQATVTVLQGNNVLAVMHPSRKAYPLQHMTVADVSIYTNGFSDRYVVLGDPQPDGGWIVKIFYNPLVPFIWFGALIMVCGGLLSLSDRRLRIGAPARQAVRPAGDTHVAV